MEVTRSYQTTWRSHQQHPWLCCQQEAKVHSCAINWEWEVKLNVIESWVVKTVAVGSLISIIIISIIIYVYIICYILDNYYYLISIVIISICSKSIQYSFLVLASQSRQQQNQSWEQWAGIWERDLNPVWSRFILSFLMKKVSTCTSASWRGCKNECVSSQTLAGAPETGVKVSPNQIIWFNLFTTPSVNIFSPSGMFCFEVATNETSLW